jgi:hypothetical protein
VKDLVASPADADRLLLLYRVATVAEVAAAMAEAGDAAAGIDAEGRLRVPDRPPRGDLTRRIVGADLEKMFAHYGVESEDVECLRRRMIFEGGWEPDEVLITNGVIYAASEPENQ